MDSLDLLDDVCFDNLLEEAERERERGVGEEDGDVKATGGEGGRVFHGQEAFREVFKLGLSLRSAISPKLSGKNLPIRLLGREIKDRTYDKVAVTHNHKLFLSTLVSERGWKYSDTTVTLFGETEDNVTVAVHVQGFQASLVYTIPSEAEGKSLKTKIAAKLCVEGELRHTFERKRRLTYFVHGKDGQPRSQLIMRLYFPSLSLWNRAKKLKGYKPYEDFIPVDTLFLAESGLTPGSFFSTKNAFEPTSFHSGVERRTICSLEFYTDMASLKLRDEIQCPATMTSLVEDIETYASVIKGNGKRDFPVSSVDGDFIYSIQYLYRKDDKEKDWTTVLLVNTNGPMERYPPPLEDGTHIFYFETEGELLDGSADFVRACNPSRVSTYYGSYFDHPYTNGRRDRSTRGSYVDQFYAHLCEDRTKKSSSKQGGLKDMTSPGWSRIDMDVWLQVKEPGQKSRSSYRLDDVHKDEFPDEPAKVELTKEEMFQHIASREPERMHIVNKYGVRDVVLTAKIEDKLLFTDSLYAHMKSFMTFADVLLYRGASAKFTNLLYLKARKNGYFMNEAPKTPDNVKDYEGAIVIDSVPGFRSFAHNGKLVLTLDFMSLYPSIMWSHNICWSSMLRPGGPEPPEGVEIETHVIGGRTYRFVRSFQALLPLIERELFSDRKYAKKMKAHFLDLFESESDPLKKREYKKLADYFEALQKSLKTGMNAAYGYLGAIGSIDPETGKREGGCPYPNFGAAETITFLGREGIHHTVAVAVEFFRLFGVEAKIVYGDTDSVFVEISRLPCVASFLTVGADGHVGVRLAPMQNEDARREWVDAMGTIVAALVTATMEPGKELEYEKLYEALILLSKKKRYVGRKRDAGGKKITLDYKGIEIMRRDTHEITRRVLRRVVELLLLGDVEGAISAVEEEMKKVVDKECPIEDFVVTKTLSRPIDASVEEGGYAFPHLMEVVQVTRKMQERGGKNAAPANGDRVAFAYAWDPSQKYEASKCDDPEYIKKQKIELDLPKYIRGAGIASTKIFEAFGSENTLRAKRVFDSYEAEGERRLSKIRKLDQSLDVCSDGSASSRLASLTQGLTQGLRRGGGAKGGSSRGGSSRGGSSRGRSSRGGSSRGGSSRGGSSRGGASIDNFFFLYKI